MLQISTRTAGSIYLLIKGLPQAQVIFASGYQLGWILAFMIVVVYKNISQNSNVKTQNFEL